MYVKYEQKLDCILRSFVEYSRNALIILYST